MASRATNARARIAVATGHGVFEHEAAAEAALRPFRDVQRSCRRPQTSCKSQRLAAVASRRKTALLVKVGSTRRI